MGEQGGADRNLAFAALLLLLTAFWLPWWLVRLTDTGGTTTAAFRLFSPFEPVTSPWAPHLTGALLVVVALALALRLTSRSWYHEPATWTRTLAGTAGACALALVSLAFWPNSIPSAWGKRTLETEGGDWIATELTMPGLAWWLTLGAAVCLGVAWWRTRATPDDASGK